MSKPTCLDSFCCAFIWTSSKLAKHSSCGVLPQNQTQQTNQIFMHMNTSVAQMKFFHCYNGLLSYLILLGLWHFLRCRLSWSCLFHHLRGENVKDSVKMFCFASNIYHAVYYVHFGCFYPFSSLSFSAYPYKFQKCPPSICLKTKV